MFNTVLESLIYIVFRLEVRHSHDSANIFTLHHISVHIQEYINTINYF